MRIIAAFFGFITGIVCGFTLVWLLPGWFREPLAQAVGGVLVGGVFGAIVGSISGEINATETGSHKAVVAFVFGALGGYLGATRLEHVWLALKYFRVPMPF